MDSVTADDVADHRRDGVRRNDEPHPIRIPGDRRLIGVCGSYVIAIGARDLATEAGSTTGTER